MSIVANDRQHEAAIADLRLKLGIPDDSLPEALDVLTRLKILGVISRFEIVDDDLLPDADAQWNPSTLGITIRRGVMDRAKAGYVEDRFTILHEIGHAVSRHPLRNRRTGESRVQFGRLVEGDEEEADRFARRFAAPSYLAKVTLETTTDQIAVKFGLPFEHATKRIEELKRQFRHEHAIPRELPKFSTLIDTGDYDEAYPEMLRNAARRNRKNT